jgi:AcrR family transcriptional regulator
MKLTQLEQEKQDRIIHALIQEYSQSGLENASTNRIVKQAGISKGSLFNYLGSKIEQYLFIVDYVMKQFMTNLNIYMQEVTMPDDYFEQLLMISQIKIRLGLEYPDEYKLLLNAYLEKDEQVVAYMEQQYNLLATDVMEQQKEMLNPDVLKNPKDRDKIVEMTFHLIAGYSENYLKKYDRLDENQVSSVIQEMTEQLQGYFDLIRKGHFKSN